MNHAQVVYGMRARVMPLARKSKVVAMKFKAPSSEPMQNIPMEITHSTCPVPRPGPASDPIALNGA